MGVFVHPTLAKACNKKTLHEMEIKHGIRATPHGHFICANGQLPEMRSTKPAVYTDFDHTPFGGDAA